MISVPYHTVATTHVRRKNHLYDLLHWNLGSFLSSSLAHFIFIFSSERGSLKRIVLKITKLSVVIAMPFLHKPSCINDRRDRDKYLLHNNRWTRAIRFSKSWRRWSNQQARVIPGWRFEFASLCACEHNFPPENTLWSHLRTPLSGVIYEQLNLTDAPSARCCRHFICSDRYCVNRSLVAWHRSAAHFHTFCSPFLCNIRKSVCYIHQCVWTLCDLPTTSWKYILSSSPCDASYNPSFVILPSVHSCLASLKYSRAVAPTL